VKLLKIALPSLALLIILPLSGRSFVADEEVVNPKITDSEIIEHIKFMASDELEGRTAGSPGAIVTSEYLAGYFKRIGLEPAGDDKTYYQNFSLPRGFEALPSTSVKSVNGRRKAEFKFGKDITVLSCSAAGKMSGPAVFAGYGVSAPMYGYDDYEGIDAKGRVVIVLRGLPGGKRGPLSDRGAARNHGTFSAKQETAAGLGAIAIIIINDATDHGSKKKDTLFKGGREPQGAIPCLHMTCRAGSKLMAGTGISLGQTQSRIDKAKRPASKQLDSLVVDVNAGIEAIQLEVRNVVGILRAGASDKVGESLTIGAHFDHIGLGEFGSRGGSKARGQVHNGADDNASGTAGVIEIAEYLAPLKNELRRDIVFAAFTAEEMGLHGSKHYVASPALPIADTVAMINLDMVGRLGRGKCCIGGVGTSPVLEDVIRKANRETRLKLSLKHGGRAPTDSTSFYEKEVPVLFFNTGLHKDYHLPADDWKLIDKRGAAKVIRLAAEVARALATAAERPPFSRADSSGFSSGPHLGVTVTQKPDGVYVTYVEKKSPASRAGFRKDDKILEFEGQPIRSSSDFYGLKAQCPPQKKISIVVRRQGRVKKMKVKLGK
jgi:hypothetical protein